MPTLIAELALVPNTSCGFSKMAVEIAALPRRNVERFMLNCLKVLK
jgi:hypothetical protein